MSAIVLSAGCVFLSWSCGQAAFGTDVASLGEALRWASDELRGDRAIAMTAVEHFSFALKWVSDELRGDREVVSAAINNSDYHAMQWASEDLRSDREFMLAAVRQDGRALRWASKGLRDELAQERDDFIRKLLMANVARDFGSREGSL